MANNYYYFFFSFMLRTYIWGCSLEPPYYGDLNKFPQSILQTNNERAKIYTLANPSFTNIKGNIQAVHCMNLLTLLQIVTR